MRRKSKQRLEVERLQRRAMRVAAGGKQDGLSDNEVAAKVRRNSDPFLMSPEWKALRRVILERHGSKCMCCGVVPRNPAHINVDHVKPRRYYPELALDESNLQVLCGRCNKRKGNNDTDYRAAPCRSFVCMSA